MDMYHDSEIDPVLRATCRHWITKLEKAKKHKREVFQDIAEECLSFYNGPKDWDDLMSLSGAGLARVEEVPDPSFKVSVNKTFEFVTIFGPALYYENPVRTVKPRMPVQVPPDFFADPLMYQAVMSQEQARVMTDGLRAVVLDAYLNWTPSEFGLAKEARTAIDEALIKGRGCLWTELYSPPGTDYRVVRSFWDSTDALLIDPDAHSFDQAKWIARKCVHPVWQVERDYGLRPGSLRGSITSQGKQADIETNEDAQYDRKRGLTSDLLVYYKVFSKMGLGGRLSESKASLKGPLEMFGDYCYMVVAENCPFPLNLPPDLTNDKQAMADPQQVFARTAWPTPFWAADSWPVSVLDFHVVHNSPWPMPHLKAGIGELKFLNWVMSFLMGKIYTTSRDFIAIKKSIGEEIKATILHGKDLELIELDHDHGTIAEIVQFLQHPEVNGDVWKMIEAVEANFDKRVGLTELMYGEGGGTQIRSAQEAMVRNQNMNVRPEDMAKQVETWMAEVARKEAICARWHLGPKDILPIFGQMAAMGWAQYVATQDLQVACRQLTYAIEAGSTRRPNKNAEVQNTNMMFQAVAPILQTYAQTTGDMQPLNNLLEDLAKALELDPNRYQLRAALPPPPPPTPSGPPGSAEHEATSKTEGGPPPQ